MKIKSISYKRVINLGSYENKHLELFAEVEEGENVEVAISSLAELVERKARENIELTIDAKDLRKEVRSLKNEVEQLKAEKDKLTGIKPDEPDPDNIPFDAGLAASDSIADPENEDMNKKYF